VILTVVLGSGMVLLDTTAVNVALPTIGRDLGASLGGLQWIMSGYTLTLAALILLGGSLGDRRGCAASSSPVRSGSRSRRPCGLAPTIQCWSRRECCGCGRCAARPRLPSRSFRQFRTGGPARGDRRGRVSAI
jgi:MFS family permease